MWQKINKLKNHQGFRKYFANTSWLMAERISRMIVALFVSVYVARYLGPERFGLLSYANSFVGLFMALATLGLDSIVVRELVKTPERREELLGTAFGLKIVGAILMWLVILAAVPFTNNDTQTNTLIAIIAFAVIFQAFNVINFNYQAEVKSKYVVHAQLIQLVISSLVKLILIFIEAPLIWFAWVYCLDAVVLAMGLAIIYLHNSGKFWVWRWKWQIARQLLLDSWPLIGSLFMTLAFMNIDKVMIKEIIGVSPVGLYTVAVQLSSVFYFIPVVVSDSLFPAIIKSKEKPELYLARIKNLFRLLFAISIGISIITTFMSQWIINILYGYEYNQASSVLIIHIWTSIFVFLGYASTKWLLIESQQRIQFFRSFFALITNIILNYFFIINYGIIGAAYATLISWIVGVYIFHFFHRSSFDLFLLKTETILFFNLIDLKKIK
jgi:O-antigen/teichoic acid export membrane protein